MNSWFKKSLVLIETLFCLFPACLCVRVHYIALPPRSVSVERGWVGINSEHCQNRACVYPRKHWHKQTTSHCPRRHKQSHPREGNLASEDPHPTPRPTVLLHYSLRHTHTDSIIQEFLSHRLSTCGPHYGESEEDMQDREREREAGTVGNNNYDNCQGTQLKDQSAVITNPPAWSNINLLYLQSDLPAQSLLPTYALSDLHKLNS